MEAATAVPVLTIEEVLYMYGRVRAASVLAVKLEISVPDAEQMIQQYLDTDPNEPLDAT